MVSGVEWREGMGKYKKALIVFLAIFVIWLGVTFYFIVQHSVIGKEAKINETVEFEGITIELNSLVLYNFERKASDFETPRNELKDKILSNLPKSLIRPYLRIQYLYSSPYDIDDEFYQTAFFGKCIFTKQTNEKADFHEYFKDNVSIKVLDSAGVGYSSSINTEYEDNSLEIDFIIGGSNFPIARFREGIKVIIKHLESGAEREFEINFQDFVNYKHNDSLGKAFPFPYKL